MNEKALRMDGVNKALECSTGTQQHTVNGRTELSVTASLARTPSFCEF